MKELQGPRASPHGAGLSVLAGFSVVAAASCFSLFFLALSLPLVLFAAAAAIATIVSIAAGNTNYVWASSSTLTQLDEYGRPFTTSDSWIRTNDPELRGSLEESSSLRSRRLSG